jgi:hypothetical protein
MLHRIEVNVVDVSLEIDFIANGVLPIAALPKRNFAVAATWHCDPCVGQRLCKPPFYQIPSRGKVRIIRR